MAIACNNLILSDVTFTNTLPTLGATVTCKVTVTNPPGNTTTDKFQIVFRENGLDPFFRSSIYDISPGTNREVTTPFTCNRTGTIEICAELVCKNVITSDYTVKQDGLSYTALSTAGATSGTVLITSTGIHTVFNKVFSTAPTGSAITIAPGIYTTTSGGCATTSGKSFKIYGYDATIKLGNEFTSGGTFFSFYGSTAVASTSRIPLPSEETPLTTNATKGNTYISVASTAGFKKGGLVVVYPKGYGEFVADAGTNIPTVATPALTDTGTLVSEDMAGITEDITDWILYNASQVARSTAYPQNFRIVSFNPGTHTAVITTGEDSPIQGGTFLPGDVFRLRQQICNFSYPQPPSEVHKVENISGNTLQVSDPLLTNYTTAFQSAAFPITPITVEIYGIKIVGVGEYIATFPIRIRHGIDCIVEDVTVSPGGATAIQIQYCYNTTVRNCTLLGNYSYVGTVAHYGYGVGITESNHVMVTGCTIDAKHTVTTGYSHHNAMGVPANIVVDNCHLMTHEGGGIVDSHLAWSYTVANSTLEFADVLYWSPGKTLGTGYSPLAIEMASPWSLIEGNIIKKCTYTVGTRSKFPDQVHIIRNNKIYFRDITIDGRKIAAKYIDNPNQTGRGTYKSVIVDGNELWDAGGILYAGGTRVDHVEITDNTLHSTGAFAKESGDYYGAYIIDCPEVLIEDNIINDSVSDGILLKGCTGIVRGNTITNPGRRTNQTSTDVGIQIDGTTPSHVTAENNTIACSDSRMAYGIQETTTPANHWNVIRNNTVTGAQVSKCSLLVGTHTTASGC